MKCNEESGSFFVDSCVGGWINLWDSMNSLNSWLINVQSLVSKELSHSLILILVLNVIVFIVAML